MIYTLKGDPTPLSRPRFGKRRVYDSQKHLKLWCGIEVKNQHRNLPLLSGPLELEITFYFNIPPTKRKKIHEDDPYVFRPDLSNLVKYVEDVCNGIVYNDDCVISRINAIKKYSMNPRTEFTLKKL